MAESSLSIDLNSLKREVGNFLGWGRDYSAWTSTMNTDFTDVHKRALRMSYFPPTADGSDKPYYEWSFLHKEATVNAQADTWQYDLPDDFSGTILDGSFTWPAASGNSYFVLSKVDEHTIRAMRTENNKKGIPKYYAVRNKAHAANTGQRYECLLFPMPNSAIQNTLATYRYVYLPNSLSGSNIYPVGGALYSELFLMAHLAAAEAIFDDDPNGVYFQKFQQQLSTAMRHDEQQKGKGDRKAKS